ncbi:MULTISPECIES: glycosyltransferase family 25 protein [unclassified Microcoleus]|uniref:glycosyltransferase family 25 protein n=1 Tax=unclassified Microcoleus TaxID=2642155 RepID=UPI001DA86BEA|nr:MULTISPECIES: glycosyltransferase family 25 protein [unclassified Microcoleus]MCC3433380.1 glycosyltransferase family 25 protein [Microcoleus sp. PH2017_04_SCI_O_A]MCC3445044.1 glycosyltransferase family 25 protein [Microcoleus sp. PH2017_03_ELD_O_A]MCC3469161.1 glycosyltransferase family 25 protein [Microcoleus sp. PH2017_06_SFM_O_A]MCC3505880.1 glycosyltransferase family 25 protein [Microcoleus sp. PH2017_19_SFW_U_A]MCC3513663.1 glycosyltransferase family 25 protein [Microcoleus sp. PH201
MKLTDFFERTYVVNLPERQDRRRDITKELANVGISLATNSVEIFPASRPETAGEFPSIGAWGCFLSHLSILKHARQQNLSNVLVMEDDLAISPTLIAQQSALIEQLQGQDWGMVYLGHYLTDSNLPKVDPNGRSSEAAVLLKPYTRAIQTTHFYGVNGQILDRLIAFLEQVQQRPSGHPDGGPMHVDGAYSTFRAQNPDITTLIAEPNLGWQRSSRSDINASAWYDYVPLVRDVANAARGAKVWLSNK